MASEWRQDGMAQAWRRMADDGTEEAFVRRVGEEYEAQVHKAPTGPTGPGRDDKVEGPIVFATREEAFAWADANTAP